MADDKIEQQIAFIIEQQAKNTVNIARLQEGMDRVDGQLAQLTAQVNRLTGHMVDLKDAMLSLINVVEKHDEQITILVEQSKETDTRFREIRERLRKIDERLN